MNIFETPDEDKFDEKDKVRLFQTVNEQASSAHHYARVLLPIAAFVLVGLIAFVFITRKGVGDEIMPAAAMRSQVYDYMLTTEKRAPTEMTFFKCDGYYWIKILAEPKPFPPSLVLDDVNQFRLEVRQAGDDKWQVSKLPLQTGENDVPCR
ncbi:MAG: hypothetical protein ACR2IH_06790 [Pyrinomonadaceae bacterium]